MSEGEGKRERDSEREREETSASLRMSINAELTFSVINSLFLLRE